MGVQLGMHTRTVGDWFWFQGWIRGTITGRWARSIRQAIFAVQVLCNGERPTYQDKAGSGPDGRQLLFLLVESCVQGAENAC